MCRRLGVLATLSSRTQPPNPYYQTALALDDTVELRIRIDDANYNSVSEEF